MIAATEPRKADAQSPYCNVAAQAIGLDPGGHGRRFDDAILIETALPWRRDLYERAGALPQEMIDLLALWLERYRQGAPYDHCPMLIAPEPGSARAGFRRVIHFTRPPGAFAHYTRAEYLAPEAEVGALVWALHEERDRLARFDEYRLPDTAPDGSPLRDLLVCTHGTVDAACAKFGFPLYSMLRDGFGSEALRVWRVSHFGGHVFAPTLLEMPSGHFWAYVGGKQGEQIAQRSGDVAALRSHYRGWAGAGDGFAQAAEREAWQRAGWAWFDSAKLCTVTATDDGPAPRWVELRIDFVRPNGERGAVAARVESATPVETRPHTGHADAHAYPQYVVSRFNTL